MYPNPKNFFLVENCMKYDDLNVVVLAYSRFEFFEKVFKQCEKNLNKITVSIDYTEDLSILDQQEKILNLIRESELNVNVISRNHNHGLVNSILRSIEYGCSVSDHVIILEDDCVPSDEFFSYMDESLKTYKDDESVVSICGTKTKCKFNPWGWATWKNKWKYEELSREQILEVQNLDESLKTFLLNNQVEKSIWSLNWLVYHDQHNVRSIFPPKNLIDNVGIDSEEGVHSSKVGYTQWITSQILKD
jgi:hypothetical protein